MPDTLKPKLTGWLSRSGFPENLLRGRPGNYHPVKHLLIVGLLFGSLEEFLARFRSVSTVTTIPAPLSSKKDSVNIEQNRASILDALRSGLSLREISRNHGRSISFIRECALSNCIPVHRRRQKLTQEIERTIWRKLYVGYPTCRIADDLQLSRALVESVMRCHPHLRKLRPKIREYESLRIHRAACAEYFQQHPNAHRDQFKVDCYKNYMWLYRNDRVWMYANLPGAIDRRFRSKNRIKAQKQPGRQKA